MSTDDKQKLINEILGIKEPNLPPMVFMRTEDKELSEELEAAKIEDIEIVVPVMQQADWGEVFKQGDVLGSGLGTSWGQVWGRLGVRSCILTFHLPHNPITPPNSPLNNIPFSPYYNL